jgi:thioesterase domain-containing protein/acyl carrier protein
MFTSGSTGLPKGVAIPQWGVMRLVWQPSYVELSPRNRVAHFAPLAFDASTFEIWGPLLNGGICVLVPEQGLELPELERHFRHHQVDTAWLTASLFNTVISERPSILGPLRQLLTGGEVLSPPHVRRARQFLGTSVRLINGYGPTESTTFACCHEITDRDLAQDKPLPIGRPIGHTQVVIQDERLTLVPPGVVGELCVGGSGLAWGYCGRSDWTAERFLPDPTGLVPEGRIYRTGDLARWNSDGVLEFLGRSDTQVKIRGHRIEPAEIEAVLRQDSAVAAAAVVVTGSAAQGLQRLVAHVAPTERAAVDVLALQQRLRETLPDYMLPAAIHTHPALPLTSSGKIDRQALRTLAEPATSPPDHSRHRDPATPTEQALAEIWRELLNCDVVDCDTSFFSLGGHSLLAVRLFHRIERDLAVRLPLESLFQHSTLGELATLVEGQRSFPETTADRQARIQPLRPGDDRPPLFLLPSATGHLLFWRPLLELVPAGLPVVGILPVRDDKDNPVWDSLTAAVAPMCDAVDRHQPTGPLHLLGYSAGVYLAQELARQLEARGRSVRFLGLIDAGPADHQPRRMERIRDVRGFVKNLVHWTLDNNHRRSWRNLRRRLSRLRKRLGWRQPGEPVLGRYRTAEHHFMRMLSHHSTGRVAAPITLFRARSLSPWQYRSDCLGWTQIGCQVEVVRFRGVDHTDIVAERNWPKLAAAIVRYLTPEQPLDSQTGPRPNLDR